MAFPVTEAELAATCGLLDPAHSQTAEIIEEVAAVIDRRPSYRTITPVWFVKGYVWCQNQETRYGVCKLPAGLA
jgi:hypothetical protein